MKLILYVYIHTFVFLRYIYLLPSLVWLYSQNYTFSLLILYSYQVFQSSVWPPSSEYSAHNLAYSSLVSVRTQHTCIFLPSQPFFAALALKVVGFLVETVKLPVAVVGAALVGSFLLLLLE